MANFGFSLRSTFGLLPKTDKIENERNQLENEFDKLNMFKESELLAEYQELDNYIDSSEFIDFKKGILELDFKKTDEFAKEQRYIKLSKDKRIVNYFKVHESADYKKFIEVENSEYLIEYQKLNDSTNSSEHSNTKQELAEKLKNEIQQKKNFDKQKKSKSFKTYFSTLNSSELANFNELNNSDELAEYNELEKLINSGQLKKVKASLANELKAEKAKTKQLSSLKKHPDIKAYNKVEDKDSIDKPSVFNEIETLESYLSSDKYQQKLNALVYTNTEEYKKELRYKEQKANTKIKIYFKFAKSKQYAVYNELEGTEELSNYLKLEEYLNSEEYQKNIDAYKFENSQAYADEQKFIELKNNDNIKHWLKYKKAKNFLLFQETENSELLNEYNELNDLTNSDKFKEYKAYMLDKEKFQKTDEYSKEARFNELKNNEEIIWYLKIYNSNKFDELKQWKVTFEDRFNDQNINDQLWMNSFFWGKMLINDRYVIAGDKQYYTDNKNFDLSGDTLKIITKNESTEGRVWHPIHGFSTQEFNYTSGMLSTAHSFRQKYGRFEAKIKIDDKNPVYQAFWLKGEKILPEIDVFKFNMEKANKMFMNSFVGDPNDSKNANKSSSRLNGASFGKDFFIYSVEWSPEVITWKINGMEVYSTSSNIPDEPLYIMLSAGIQRDPNGLNIDSAYEVDWIRCYEKINLAG